MDLEKSLHGMPSLEAGVFTLASGSALTDMGTPGSEPGHDAGNRVRPLDGDSDGIARRDIGAFEAPAGTSVEPAKVTLIDPTPAVETPPPGPGVPQVPNTQPVPPAAGKPVVAFAGLTGRTLRGRSAGGIARVQVAARMGKRCATKAGALERAKRCGWITAKGARTQSLTFARRPPRGTYTVRLRGLDARGEVVAAAGKRVRVA